MLLFIPIPLDTVVYIVLNFSVCSLCNLYQLGFYSHSSTDLVILDVTNVFRIGQFNGYFSQSSLCLILATFDTDNHSSPKKIFCISYTEHTLSHGFCFISRNTSLQSPLLSPTYPPNHFLCHASRLRL